MIQNTNFKFYMETHRVNNYVVVFATQCNCKTHTVPYIFPQKATFEVKC